MSERELHFGFTIWPTGFHPAGWRLPEAWTDGNYSPDVYREMAQAAERGKFDFFFIGDQVVGLPEWQYTRPNQVLRPDAIALAGYVAAVTERIGIIATVNTTYSDPYNVARSTATVDILSKGRLGWNIVTGGVDDAAGNFGRKVHWDNDHRYDAAFDFAEIVTRLWDSWEDGAKVVDKTTGEFVDEARVHRIDYQGKYYSSTGPLNVERPPQGQIPIINAGTSERSRDLGGRFSDIKFVNSSNLGLIDAKEYYRDLKSRVADYGREPDDQYVISGITVYTAETARAAHEKFRQIQDLWKINVNLGELGAATGVDFSSFTPDVKISEVPGLSAEGGAGRKVLETVQLAREQYGEDDLTLRELYLAFRRGAPMGFREIVGSPVQIADQLQQWWEERAVDGFMIFPPFLPTPLIDFVDLVVPELQRRGIFRREYSGRTLREHFSLPRPLSRYTPAGQLAG